MLKEVRTQAAADSEEDSFFIGGLFLGAVTEMEPNITVELDWDTDWDIELKVNGSPVEFKIDTGADTTVMKEQTFKLPHQYHVQGTKISVLDYGD